jgi:uncharacterized protein YjlB
MGRVAVGDGLCAISTPDWTAFALSTGESRNRFRARPFGKEENVMTVAENAKKLAEKATGIGRPNPQKIGVRDCEPEQHIFPDDGETPNNQSFAFLLYRDVVVLDEKHDPAAIFEELFAKNGWTDSWRDGIYDFLHFHTHTHEALGIARGSARVQFGGKDGPVIEVCAGDVVVQPAGTGHRRIEASNDLLVVGAYPAGHGKYNQPRPKDIPLERARRDIAAVPAPACDPVYGAAGPLVELWI